MEFVLSRGLRFKRLLSEGQYDLVLQELDVFEKELNDLEVIIKDSLGNVIYYNVTTVSGYTTYPILIDNWNKGEYTIQLKKGSSYMQGIIRIE